MSYSYDFTDESGCESDMAEGFEEGAQENNSNGGGGGTNMDAIAMVGAVIPKCDSSPHLASNTISALTNSTISSSLGSSSSTTGAALKRDFIAESAKIPPSSPSPGAIQQMAIHHQQQHQHLNQSQPINLKSEVSHSSYQNHPRNGLFVLSVPHVN